MNKDVTAFKISANLKYGNKVDFGTAEEACELIKKYPVLYPSLPTELRYDKSVALAFCDGNGEPYRQYLSRCDGPIYDRIPAAEYDGKIWLYGKIDFGPLAQDKEVLEQIGKNSLSGFIDFTDGNYNEKALGAVLGEYPEFIINAYTYWLGRISGDAKLVEHIRVKYELFNEPSDIELTFYKCVELLQAYCPKSESGYFNLLCCCTRFNDHYGKNYVKFMRKTIRGLSVELQRELVWRCFFLAQFVRYDDLEQNVVKTIAEFCPIAAEYLPDEALLRFKLKPRGLKDGDMRSVCLGCNRCDFIKYFYEEDYSTKEG